MPFAVSNSIRIAAQPETVSDFAANPRNAPSWHSHIKGTDWSAEQLPTVGATFTFFGRIGLVPFSYRFEVREHALGKKLVMRSLKGPMNLQIEYHWRAAGSATEMTYSSAGSLKFLGALFDGWVGSQFEKANRKELASLRDILSSLPS